MLNVYNEYQKYHLAECQMNIDQSRFWLKYGSEEFIGKDYSLKTKLNDKGGYSLCSQF